MGEGGIIPGGPASMGMPAPMPPPRPPKCGDGKAISMYFAPWFLGNDILPLALLEQRRRDGESAEGELMERGEAVSHVKRVKER